MATKRGLELCLALDSECLMSTGKCKNQEKQFLLEPRWMSPTAKQHHRMVSTLPEDSTALSGIRATLGKG